MANYFSFQRKINRLEKRYMELKREFLKSGDINIFLDFDQDLYNLSDRILEAIADPKGIADCDEFIEMNEAVSGLMRDYRSLLHSA